MSYSLLYLLLYLYEPNLYKRTWSFLLGMGVGGQERMHEEYKQTLVNLSWSTTSWKPIMFIKNESTTMRKIYFMKILSSTKLRSST